MNFNKLCLVVNTVSHCSDLWGMFFGQIEKHFPNNKIYVFSDISTNLPENVIPVLYNPKDNFRTQYLNCIKEVEEPFLIYLNEDYILYNDVNIELIKEYLDVLIQDDSISFIKTNRNMNTANKKYCSRNDLFYLNPDLQYFYSQNVALWRKETLMNIHESSPDLHIAGLRTLLQFEVEANKVCKKMNLNGLYSYHNEPKRGKYHYDSIVFPYIATAIIKGRWNLKEYFVELNPLLKKYDIDIKRRGDNR